MVFAMSAISNVSRLNDARLTLVQDVLRDGLVIAHVAYSELGSTLETGLLTRHSDESSLPGCTYAACDRTPSSNLDDSVNTSSAVQPPCLDVPRIDLRIVDRLDDVGCAALHQWLQEILRAVKLGLGRRGEDDFGTGNECNLACQLHLRDLQSSAAPEQRRVRRRPCQDTTRSVQPVI